MKARYFVIWGVESSIIGSDSNLTYNIIMETIEEEEKRTDQDRILTYFRVNCTLRRWIVLLDSSYSFTTEKWLSKKKNIDISTIKFNFMKKINSMLYAVKKHLKYQELWAEWHQRCQAPQNSISLNCQTISIKTR